MKFVRLEPPSKAHIIRERLGKETVVTECGLELVNVTDIEAQDLEKQSVRKPVKEARCKGCWPEA